MRLFFVLTAALTLALPTALRADVASEYASRVEAAVVRVRNAVNEDVGRISFLGRSREIQVAFDEAFQLLGEIVNNDQIQDGSVSDSAGKNRLTELGLIYRLSGGIDQSWHDLTDPLLDTLTEKELKQFQSEFLRIAATGIDAGVDLTRGLLFFYERNEDGKREFFFPKGWPIGGEHWTRTKVSYAVLRSLRSQFERAVMKAGSDSTKINQVRAAFEIQVTSLADCAPSQQVHGGKRAILFFMAAGVVLAAVSPEILSRRTTLGPGIYLLGYELAVILLRRVHARITGRPVGRELQRLEVLAERGTISPWLYPYIYLKHGSRSVCSVSVGALDGAQQWVRGRLPSFSRGRR